MKEILDRLGVEFERVAHEPHRRRLRLRSLLLGVASALSVSAVALAASGVLGGEPVRNSPGVPKPTAHVGVGLVQAGSAMLTSLRIPDPAGGPPWGLRTLTTTRTLGCVQVGRVVDGKLGVLGKDGAFADDGLFHELPPDVDQDRDCELLDGAGKLYVAMAVLGAPASAHRGSCIAQRPPAFVRKGMSKAQRKLMNALTRCPKADMRIFYYGTVGPEATSVTYEEHGVQKTSPTAGPWGAYLVVLRPDREHPARGYFTPGTSPGSGLVSVNYRDGHSCRIRNPRALGGAKPCPRVGYAALPHKAVTSAQVKAPVTARFMPRPEARHGAAAPRAREIHVSFTARVDGDAHRIYTVSLRAAKRSDCPHMGMTVAPITHDVAAGQSVTETLYVSRDCQGSVTGEVRFHPPSSKPSTGPFGPANPFRGPLVGTYTAQIPRR